MTEGLDKWKAAVVQFHKQQRQQRGRRRDASSLRITGPGMLQRLPAAGDPDGDHDDGGQDDGPWHD